jgi:hypothetical protein
MPHYATFGHFGPLLEQDRGIWLDFQGKPAEKAQVVTLQNQHNTMVAILAGGDVGQQSRSRQPALDRARRRRSLHDAAAACAGVLLAHVPDHLEVTRHELQHLGDILVELAQLPAAVRAGAPIAYGGREVNDRLAR